MGALIEWVATEQHRRRLLGLDRHAPFAPADHEVDLGGGMERPVAGWIHAADCGDLFVGDGVPLGSGRRDGVPVPGERQIGSQRPEPQGPSPDVLTELESKGAPDTDGGDADVLGLQFRGPPPRLFRRRVRA